MIWKAYRLVYQAKSPIHIGWHTLGYIKLTRHYIPGRAMWGAMTANMTRTYGEKGTADYKKFGAIFQKDILASYFYPAIDPETPLLPRYTDRGIEYGDSGPDCCPRVEFEKRFIGSFGQTAVLPQSNTAEDETLHESEYMVPTINKDGVCKPVFFIGYLFIKESAIYQDGKKIDWRRTDMAIKPAIREVFVGGDMKYGWGRLALVSDKLVKGEVKKIFGYNFSDKTDHPGITIPPGSPLPAHLKIDHASTLAVKGDMEPLVGRNLGTVEKDGEKQTGAGKQISEAELCWMPGSIMTELLPRQLTLSAFGLLRRKRP